MAKPEWGTKRLCPSCGTRFYDMKRNPVDCPSCEETVPTETVVRTRRSPRPAVVTPKPAKKPEVAVEEGADIDADIDEDNDDDNSLIEDTSDLAEDEEVSEITEHTESKDKVDS